MKFHLLFIWLLVLTCFTNVVTAQTSSQFEVITPENIQHLEKIAVLGRGLIFDVEWSPDGQTIAAATETGVWLYNPENMLLPPTNLLQQVTLAGQSHQNRR